MGFEAEPKSIAKFGEEMDRLFYDANSAKCYVEDWLNVTGADARIFATIASAAESVGSALIHNYIRMASIQRSAAFQLDKAALMYQKTDVDEAERLDETYPAGG